MLVNARLLYILVDGLHYSSGGQVMISTVTCFYVSATAIVWIDGTLLQSVTAIVWMGGTTLQFRWPGDLDH
jgi:hypothetical protein